MNGLYEEKEKAKTSTRRCSGKSLAACALPKIKRQSPGTLHFDRVFGGVFFEGKCLKMLPSFILPLLIWSEFFNQLKLSNCLKLFLTMMQMN